MTETLDGLVLLNKPAGVTSFKALRPVKELLPKKTKVGHTGTLDQFATGLLPVLIGKATRLVPLFSNFDKSYRGTVRFGEQTETLDPESEPEPRGEPPTLDQLAAALSHFVGEIEQVPPAYSAVHVGGERAYRRVLRGEEVEIPSRLVTVHALELLSYEPPDAEFLVRCSKGTYVRSLARDIGARCGCGAYVRKLSRESVGPFRLAEGVSKPSLGDIHPLEEIVSRLPELCRVDLGPREAGRVANGAKIRATLSPDKLEGDERFLALHNCEGRLVAIAEHRGSRFEYILVRP